MKWRLRSILLLAIVGVSCTTTTNNIVNNSLAPTITGFSPDTVWTGTTDTIYGTHFGYDPLFVRVTIDTTPVDYVTYLADTIMTITVPEYARTGFIHVWAYEQTATSTKPVVVDYTFNPHAVYDTFPDGTSFSIPGTGMNHYHGLLRLSVGGIQFPIDSVFSDRIVSHVLTNSQGGSMDMYDSVGSYNVGSLTVTRGSSWKTLSQIFNYMRVTETHQRTKYANGSPSSIDSTWKTIAAYTGQHDTNIAGIKFTRTSRGLQYDVYSIQEYNAQFYNDVPLFKILWDTVSQTAVVTYTKYLYVPKTQTHTIDTFWYSNSGQSLSAPLPVDNDIEFVLPSFGYQITEDSTDTQGLVTWQTVTTTQVTSGEFDIILKH